MALDSISSTPPHHLARTIYSSGNSSNVVRIIAAVSQRHFKRVESPPPIAPLDSESEVQSLTVPSLVRMIARHTKCYSSARRGLQLPSNPLLLPLSPQDLVPFALVAEQCTVILNFHQRNNAGCTGLTSIGKLAENVGRLLL